MKNSKKLLLTCLFTLLPLHSYAATSADEVEKILTQEPEILEKIFKKNPKILNDAVIQVLRDNNELLIDIIQQGADSKRRSQLKAQWEEDSKTPKKVTLEDRPTRGDANAPVTVIAFSDFACTYCMQSASVIENLLKRHPDIRFVFKQYVSDSPAAQEAAKWFLAALDIDKKKGWNYYALLFSNQQSFFANPSETLRLVASQAGLDPREIERTLKKNNKKYTQILEEDIREAEELGFTGTPSFLVNDLVILGSMPLETFADAYSFALELSQ